VSWTLHLKQHTACLCRIFDFSIFNFSFNSFPDFVDGGLDFIHQSIALHASGHFFVAAGPCLLLGGPVGFSMASLVS
jgi:hypothetical protein